MGIKADNLTKTYRIKNQPDNMAEIIRNFFAPKYKYITAVDNLSFTIPSGDIVGFIGANGAGKSTTIKMMTGILTPDQGEISINGLDLKKNHKEIMLKIGVVIGQRSQLCWDIPVVESLKLFKDMYHVPEKIYKENIKIFSDILDLSEFIYKPPRLLSLGQRMRADLAAALLHNPEILFLDEPTIGIDILAKAKIREFIRTINHERNATIILTTHDISDIEALCQNMIIIDRGTILYNGTLNELKRLYDDSCQRELDQNAAVESNFETIIKKIYEGDFL